MTDLSYASRTTYEMLWHTPAATAITPHAWRTNITTWHSPSPTSWHPCTLTAISTATSTILTTDYWHPWNTTVHNWTATNFSGFQTQTTATSVSSTVVNLPTKLQAATVIVGAAGSLTFAPPSINASIGTMIHFDFLALNHTLTQSDFANPCHYDGLFDTGFTQFNPSNISGNNVVKYRVMSEEPQWFFCSQTISKSHCKAGMVFSLNPPVGAHKKFLQNALAAVVPTSGGAFCQAEALVPSASNFPSHTSSNLSSKLNNNPPTAISPILNQADAVAPWCFGLIPLLILAAIL